MALVLPCACDDLCIVMKHTDSLENERRSTNYCHYDNDVSTFPHSAFCSVCLSPSCIYLAVEICMCTSSTLEGHISIVKFLFQGDHLLL